MRTYLDCIPCFMNQVIRTGRLLGLAEPSIKQILSQLGKDIEHIPMDDPPPKIAIKVYDLINKYAGLKDPFHQIKKQGTQKALALYPVLRQQIDKASDPLGHALRLSVIGNVIDFGVSSDYDLEAELESLVHQPLAIWHEDRFKEAVKSAQWVLYLADNTGETVFDRLLIETMNIPITYVVREGPIINDATYEDAVDAGLDKICRIISSGCRAPGTILELCSPGFRMLFDTAPLIISKGQGNFETLSHEKAPIFFLLKAKCQVVADHLSIRVGDLLLVDSQA